MFRVKRVYETPSPKDGLRILVCRLWPRGLTKERAAVDLWLKELGPSTELRKWFRQDLAKWKEFQIRYRKELRKNPGVLKRLKQMSTTHTITLMYGARDEAHNGALVLKRLLEGPGKR
jgi:uncharacterized protein YeaO (DUF488 family)